MVKPNVAWLYRFSGFLLWPSGGLSGKLGVGLSGEENENEMLHWHLTRAKLNKLKATKVFLLVAERTAPCR